jgi:hypothetical protein
VAPRVAPRWFSRLGWSPEWAPELSPTWPVSRVVSRVASRVVSRVVSPVADPGANPLASPFSLLGVILLRCLSILLKSPKRVFKGSRREAGILGIRFRTVGIINGPGRPFSYTGVCEIIVAIDFVCGLPSRGPSLFQCCAHAALECKGVRNNRRLLHGLFFEIDNFEIGGPGGLTGNEYKTFRGRRLFRTHRSRVTTEFLI